MPGITYDTGALLAAERLDRRVWVLHRRGLERGAAPTVPAGVLARAWRGGGRQANLARFLGPCEVEPLTDRRARAVGAALALTQTTDIVDASVVIGAAMRGDTIVTSDPVDLQAVADRLAIAVEIVDV